MKVPAANIVYYDNEGPVNGWQHVTKFKHKQSGEVRYLASKRLRHGFRVRSLNAYFDNAREAAKAVDIFLIRYGKDPVNILKPCPKKKP